MTIDLLPEHLLRLDEMSALLRVSEDCTIAFVRCNEPILCDAVNAEIKRMVSNKVFIYPEIQGFIDYTPKRSLSFKSKF